ncbi:ABC transporter substrate-binding protein [Paenibacillus hodogayensis]|uniref:ABC transporter substrate-binding protein n=1 Tax=Paenibacillus hodogayensis TaxID=279208 RepID=A0ABV5VX75_9BACL
MNKSRVWRTFSVVLASASLFAAGCSGKQSGGSEAAANDGRPPSPAPAEPVELAVHATMSGMTEDFMKKHFGAYITKKFPHVTLKYMPTVSGRTTKDYLASGEKFDILITPSGSTPGSLLDNQLQLDLTPFIKKYNFDLNKLESSSVDIQRKFAGGEGIYGIPFTANTLVLFYNKDLFNQFGVPLPTNHSTWDDIYESVKKLSRTEGGTAYRGLTAAYWHLFLLNQTSTPGQDAKTFKSLYMGEPYKKEMEFMTSFFRVPGNNWEKGTSVAEMVNAFVQGTSAMYVGLDNTWQLYKFPKELNWDMIRLPQRKEMPDTGPQTYPNYMYVTSTSKHPDTAFQVAAAFASDEFQSYYTKQGYLPVTKNSAELMKQYSADLPEFAGKNKDILWPKLAPSTGVTKYQSIDTKYEGQLFIDIVTGKKDINTALRDAAEAHDKDLAAALSK